MENAVKIARAHTGRTAVIAFDHAYHGRTNLTMALTAKVMPYKAGFGPFAPEVYRVPMAYPYRWPTGPEACADEAFAEFISRVHVQVGEENVAAVLVEPIQGEGGFIVPAPGFLARVAQWCRDFGIVFIADEIQTGFCRTGDWFACEREGIVPDLVTTAKALGDRDHDPRRPRARRIGKEIDHRLRELSAQFPQIGDIRGRGAMMAMELVRPGGSKTPDAVLTKSVLAGCARRGLVALGCGTYGNVIRLLPPLVIEFSLLAEALDILAESLAEATA